MYLELPPLILVLNEQLKLQGFLKRLWFMLLFRNKEAHKALDAKCLLSRLYISPPEEQQAFVRRRTSALHWSQKHKPKPHLCPAINQSSPSGQSAPCTASWAFPEYRQHLSNVVRSNLRKQPPSTATNFITHIFFDVLWFHGFVRIIRGVKCAKYKPGKNKQTINGLNWFPVRRKFFFLPCVLNVDFALVKSVRIWFKLECAKYSTGVILHRWIQNSYCQWHEWRAKQPNKIKKATTTLSKGN